MKNVVIGMALGLLIACGSSEEEEQQAQQQAEEIAQQLSAQLNQAAQQVPANMAATPAQPAAANPAATPTQGAAGASNFGTIELDAGFVPDPHTANGTSGGATNASSFGAECVGYISDTPDHLFVAKGAFANLRVMAHSQADITLVIQKPDGTYSCNDDSVDGTHPLVEGSFPPGTYKIWIGSYEQGTNSPYTLGFSELSSVTPTKLVSG